MAVEILSSTYEQDTRKKLIDDDCPRFLLLIFNFAFLPMIQDIMRCGPRHEPQGARISRALLPMEVALPRNPDVSTDVHSHGNRRNPADGHRGLTSPSSDLRTRRLKSSQLTSLRTQNAGLLWPPITH